MSQNVVFNSALSKKSNILQISKQRSKSQIKFIQESTIVQ